MAHLNVQPKKTKPWWIWLLLVIIAIVLLFFLIKGCDYKTKSIIPVDSTANKISSASKRSNVAIAATEPDWNNVDFNAAPLPDADITDKDISVSGNETYTIYGLGDNILFGKDEGTLQPAADRKLEQIAGSLAKHFKDARIGVYGSTDSTGDTGHNRQLGAERAASVKEWLIKNGGFNASRVSIHSFGASRPVASNTTEKGRQQNRNVQIVAFPDKSRR